MDKPYVVGIDVGGTNTVAGIVDKRGQILISGSIKTSKHLQVEDYLDELTELIDGLIAEVTTKDQIRELVPVLPTATTSPEALSLLPIFPGKE